MSMGKRFGNFQCERNREKILNVAVVGLGSMGSEIAEPPLRCDFDASSFDVNKIRENEFIANERSTGYPIDMDFSFDVIVGVPNTPQTKMISFGDIGIGTRMRSKFFITACPLVFSGFTRLKSQNCFASKLHYLDGPISGAAEKAAEGRLSKMASESKVAFEAERPISDSMTEFVFQLGDLAVAGSAMKAVNQVLADARIVAVAEAITFATTQEICADKFYKVLSKCAEASWMLEYRSPHVVEGDFSSKSALNIWPKDLDIVLEIAGSSNFHCPMMATLKQFDAGVSMGLIGENDSAVVKVFANNSNPELPSRKKF